MYECTAALRAGLFHYHQQRRSAAVLFFRLRRALLQHQYGSSSISISFTRCILLDGKASHIIEGDYYALQPYDISVFCARRCCPKRNIPWARRRELWIINFAIPRTRRCLGGMLRQRAGTLDAEVPIYRLGDAGAPPPSAT